MYEPKGSFSQMTMDAIRRAETLQALTLQDIGQKYETKRPSNRDEPKPLEEFINELEEAYATGQMAELNAKYARMLMPLIIQVTQPQPEQGAQNGLS